MELAHNIEWRQQSSCWAASASSLCLIGVSKCRLNGCPLVGQLGCNFQEEMIRWWRVGLVQSAGFMQDHQTSREAGVDLTRVQAVTLTSSHPGPQVSWTARSVSSHQQGSLGDGWNVCFDLGCLLWLPKSIPTLAGQKLWLCLMTEEVCKKKKKWNYKLQQPNVEWRVQNNGALCNR